MANARIAEFRREISELARKLAIEQGHYPVGGAPLQHTMEPEPETACPTSPHS